MIPVHLPYKEQWFILVISILDCCILFLIPLTSVKTLNITLSYTHLKANSSVRNAGCYTLRKVSFFKRTRFPQVSKANKQNWLWCFYFIHCRFSGKSWICQFWLSQGSVNHWPFHCVGDTISRVMLLSWLLEMVPKHLDRIPIRMNPQDVSLTKKSPVLVWVIISPRKLKDTSCLFHAISNQLSHMGKPLKTASQLYTKVVSFLQNNPTAPNGIHFREFVNHGGWETYLWSMSMDGRWRDPTALLGMVNILCICVAVVS